MINNKTILNGWVDKEKVLEIAKLLSKNGYGKYLYSLVLSYDCLKD
ncbi:hypothetical protein [Aliarcobacter cryaerophilus]|nr:hypothetical protein [Aliarcobacter cryaerophilus]MCT7516107.1 hypothetical protein [Aliarcobacter cryaerophilus]